MWDIVFPHAHTCIPIRTRALPHAHAHAYAHYYYFIFNTEFFLSAPPQRTPTKGDEGNDRSVLGSISEAGARTLL